MKKHEYEAVIQQGSLSMVVRYWSFHRKGSRGNKVDMYKSFGRTYGAIWHPDTVIHEINTIG